GRLVAPGAPPADWADAVEQVWTDARTLSAEEVAADVRARYGPEAWVERVDEVYRGLGAGSRSAAARGVAASRGSAGSDASTDARRVDGVIAVHDPRRQVGRAVRSVLDGSGDLPVRVTVVCHDLPAAEIETALGEALVADPR